MNPMNFSLSTWTALVLAVLLLAFPWLAAQMGAEYYTGVLRRILIFALLATSLTLINFGVDGISNPRLREGKKR